MAVTLVAAAPIPYGPRPFPEAVRSCLRHLKDHVVPHHRNGYRPHLLGHRALGLMSALLLTVKLFTIAAVTYGPVPEAYSSAITSDTIVELTNRSRLLYGLPALSENQVLARAAQAKADDMLAKGYFSHNTPDGKTPWDFVKAAGYRYLSAGENLAVNFTEAEKVDAAWMNSPGHRANIVNKTFEEIGIGIASGTYQGRLTTFVVQMFGTPAEQPVQALSEPTQIQRTEVPVPEPDAAAAAAKPQASAAKPAPTPPAQAPAAPPVAIETSELKLDGEDVVVEVTTNSSASKVLATFGQQGVMLEPKGEGRWVGRIPSGSLGAGDVSVRVLAYDLLGNTALSQLADFTNRLATVYEPAQVRGAHIELFGRTFDPTQAERGFYLTLISVVIASLILAIGLKRHVQHVGMVANASFVVVLATLLWAGA